MMAEIPSHKTFAGLLNAVFNIHLDAGQTVDTELVEVSQLKVSPEQEIFYIVFRGPNDVSLGQGMRRFQHERTGTLIFSSRQFVRINRAFITRLYSIGC